MSDDLFSFLDEDDETQQEPQQASVATLERPAAGSRWVCPFTEIEYMANEHGYFEQFCAGRIEGKQVLKAGDKEAEGLIPLEEWLAATTVIEAVTGEIVEDETEKPKPAKFDYQTELKMLAEEAADVLGWSKQAFEAHAIPLQKQHGRTQACIDAIEERMREFEPVEPAKEDLPAPVVDEHGEVVNADEFILPWLQEQELKQLFNLSTYEEFEVRDEQTADWLVRKIRESQQRAERIAQMATAGIQECLRYQQGMIGRYGYGLRQWAESQLVRTKEGSKKPYRSKNVKLSEGAVHFKKGGGWKCTNPYETQKFIDGIPSFYDHLAKEAREVLAYIVDQDENNREASRDTLIEVAKRLAAALKFKSDLEAFPVTFARKFHKSKMAKACEDEPVPGYEFVEVNELATMSIGDAKSGWTPKRIKDKMDEIKIEVIEDEGEEE